RVAGRRRRVARQPAPASPDSVPAAGHDARRRLSRLRPGRWPRRPTPPRPTPPRPLASTPDAASPDSAPAADLDARRRLREELVVDDVPRLERLLCRGVDCETIQINKAPKLKVLGPLSPHVSKIRIANLVFQGRIPPSLGHSICTVNILALKFSGPDLKAILGVLSCFPCLEKLYVIWDIYLKAKMKNLHQYDPLNPVKCLESHLKVLVLKNYTGGEEEVGFAKFFVFNARVVKEINFAVCDRIAIDKNWMTDQLRLLQVEARASQDARLKFRSGYSHLQTNYVNSSDLSIADPFS
uniref:FBD domain-containing protein n=1 Tax=Aegilops tauschii subsp. strangulata TaxID=200361 RepID=A0A452XTH9_AEGTS